MNDLGRMAWPDVEASGSVLIPLGSSEQHGPHLPFDTDTRIATAIAHRAATLTGAVVAPPLAYGSSGEHAGFAGTLSIGTPVLKSVLVELVRSARLTFDRVVFVNGHGGNHQAVTAATAQMVSEGHDVTNWSPSIPGGDAHAGRVETSLLLAIAPDVVRLNRAERGRTEPIGELIDELRVGGVAAVSPNGVLGDPIGATAEEGARLLERLAVDLAEAVGAS